MADTAHVAAPFAGITLSRLRPLGSETSSHQYDGKAYPGVFQHEGLAWCCPCSLCTGFGRSERQRRSWRPARPQEQQTRRSSTGGAERRRFTVRLASIPVHTCACSRPFAPAAEA